MSDQQKDVYTQRIFITAEMARTMLRKNLENNRPMNSTRVSQYCRDMKSGRWKENGDTIKFSDEDKLIDGQHRLAAAVEGGIGFWSQVAYGVKQDAFLTIDRNQTRSTGQLLHLVHGIQDYNALSGCITWFSRFREGIMLGTTFRPTTIESAELLQEHPGLVDSVAAARRVITRFKAGTVAVVAVSHYLFSHQDASLAELFFDALATGAGLREMDPVYRLRERIISASSSTSKRIGTYELFALYFKAWLAEREQRTVQTLRWMPGESFPNIGPVFKNKMYPEKKVVAGVVPKKPKRVKLVSTPLAPAPTPKETSTATKAPDTQLDRLLAKQMSVDGGRRAH